jgi:hypothetical protein
MARRTSPVSPTTLAADHATVIALQSLVDYQPLNPDYSVASLLQAQATLAQADHTEQELITALAQARKVRADTSHFYHNNVVGSRAHVVVQYGPDAAAVSLVGLTRKSERKRPAKRQPVAK